MPEITLKKAAKSTSARLLSILSDMGEAVKIMLLSKRVKRNHGKTTELPTQSENKGDIQSYNLAQIQRQLLDNASNQQREAIQWVPQQKSNGSVAQQWTPSKRKLPPSDVVIQNPNLLDSFQKGMAQRKNFGPFTVTTDEANQRVALQQSVFTSQGIDFRHCYGVQSSNSARAMQELRNSAAMTLRGNDVQVTGNNTKLVQQASDSKQTRLQRWGIATSPALNPASHTPQNLSVHQFNS